MFFRKNGVLLSLVLLSSCSLMEQKPVEDRARWKIYEDLYDEMEPGKGHIAINLYYQEVKMYNERGELVLETDVSTGVPASPTPIGEFTILEKLESKYSNLYGSYVDSQTGKDVVAESWKVKDAPPGTEFKGKEMPYWMRLTWDGIGMHVGSFDRRHPNSFGCIRVPRKIQPKIYEKCEVGMKVTISDPYPAMLENSEKYQMEIHKPKPASAR